MKALVRRLSSLIAAFALAQATAAPAIAACDRMHATMDPAIPSVTTMDQSSPASTGHEDCEASEVPPSQTQHSEDCQASCVSMMGCTTLSFVGAFVLLDVPDESPLAPTLAMLTYLNRSLAPESPPPRA